MGVVRRMGWRAGGMVGFDYSDPIDSMESRRLGSIAMWSITYSYVSSTPPPLSGTGTVRVPWYPCWYLPGTSMVPGRLY